VAIPVPARLFWRSYEKLAVPSLLQLPDDRVRAASDRRNRMLRLPGAAVILGKPHPGVLITRKTASLPDGTALPLRVYRPAARRVDVLPVVVYFHGGGFCFGEAYLSEWWCTSLAHDAEVVVVSVEYRLAPEHRYPTQVEDGYGATRWVAEHAADLGADPAALTVMGEDAGGNIAAAVALMARDRGGPALARQVLMYPVLDLAGRYPSDTENATAPVLTTADLRAAADRYAGPEQQREAYASPLMADSHAGLPPALIQTAHHDPLRDQGAAYAAALRRAGVAVTRTDYVDALHGYVSMPGLVPASRQALAEVVGVLRSG
jgi:acetyl esterase